MQTLTPAAMQPAINNLPPMLIHDRHDRIEATTLAGTFLAACSLPNRRPATLKYATATVRADAAEVLARTARRIEAQRASLAQLAR